MSSAIAQLVEQAAVNRWVVGSSPTRGAIRFLGTAVPFLTQQKCRDVQVAGDRRPVVLLRW